MEVKAFDSRRREKLGNSPKGRIEAMKANESASKLKLNDFKLKGRKDKEGDKGGKRRTTSRWRE